MPALNMGDTRFDNGARLIDFTAWPPAKRRIARANNFIVEWRTAAGVLTGFESTAEVFVLFAADGGAILGPHGRTTAPPDSVVITPPGAFEVEFAGSGAAVIIATDRLDCPGEAQARDALVAPIGRPFRRLKPLEQPEVWPVQDIPYPPDNKRLKFIQSATMSINLVVYDGPRGNTALTPHAHADFEQGSLSVDGDFVHHLRTPWGPNGGDWREDVHAEAGVASLVLVPPTLIHTSEGVLPGRHFLVDIFAPPRRDFIAKGWVVNAADYEDPLK